MKYKRITYRRYRYRRIRNKRKHRYKQLKKIIRFADDVLYGSVLVTALEWRGLIMTGCCKPKETGVIFDGERIIISLHDKQIWQYKYGMLNGKNVVKVSRDNVRLYLNKDVFESEWKIVKT